ncbi:hypothetical protein CEXT_334841 [Caerostris extrusa]|uniref:Uncharacterized protein n=1 Tax=Caerostris extrusa TaxID=172846 RepID=A0AAV4UZS7_CAEEX|nr:hypothetical protein CEXT_334841 [Caerostris extrusa]
MSSQKMGHGESGGAQFCLFVLKLRLANPLGRVVCMCLLPLFPVLLCDEQRRVYLKRSGHRRDISSASGHWSGQPLCPLPLPSKGER